MNVNKYFKELNEKIDNLSDEELEELLLKSGLDSCPFEDDSQVIVSGNIHKNKKSIHEDFVLSKSGFREVVTCESISLKKTKVFLELESEEYNTYDVCYSREDDAA